MVSVVDRLLLLAMVARDANGDVALAPPPGGYVVSALELDDAMRLLGGPHPRLMLAGIACLILAVPPLVLASLLVVAGVTGA
jgi:hypothetical protein